MRKTHGTDIMFISGIETSWDGATPIVDRLVAAQRLKFAS